MVDRNKFISGEPVGEEEEEKTTDPSWAKAEDKDVPEEAVPEEPESEMPPEVSTPPPYDFANFDEVESATDMICHTCREPADYGTGGCLHTLRELERLEEILNVYNESYAQGTMTRLVRRDIQNHPLAAKFTDPKYITYTSVRYINSWRGNSEDRPTSIAGSVASIFEGEIQTLSEDIEAKKRQREERKWLWMRIAMSSSLAVMAFALIRYVQSNPYKGDDWHNAVPMLFAVASIMGMFPFFPWDLAGKHLKDSDTLKFVMTKEFVLGGGIVAALLITVLMLNL